MIQKYKDSNSQCEVQSNFEFEQEDNNPKLKLKSKSLYEKIGIIKTILPGKGNRFDQIRISHDNRFVILTNLNSAGHEVILFELSINDKKLRLTELHMKRIRKMNFNEVIFFKNTQFFILDFQKSLEFYEIRNDDNTCHKIQVIQTRNIHQSHAKPCLNQNENLIYSSLEKNFLIFKIDRYTWNLKHSIQLPEQALQICPSKSDKQIIIRGSDDIYIIQQIIEEKWLLLKKIRMPQYILRDLLGFQRDEIYFRDKKVQLNRWNYKFIRQSKIILPKNYEQIQFRQFNILGNLAYFEKKKSVRVLQLINDQYIEQQIIQLDSKIGSLTATNDGQLIMIVIQSKIHVFQLKKGK